MSPQYGNRYPGIAFLLHVTNDPAIDDPPVEKPLPQEEIVYHFGLERGARFAVLRSWLEANSKRQLIYIDDRIASFHSLEQEVIDHPQVELHHATDWESLLDHLAITRPRLRISIEGKERFASHQESLRKKTWEMHALAVDVRRGASLFQNIAANMRRIPTAFDPRTLKNRFRGVAALICGAGPSLTRELDPQRQLIIAGGSAIPILSKRGIEPHFSIAFDPNPEEKKLFAKSDHFHIPLLFGSRLHPEAAQVANSPLGYIPTKTMGFAAAFLESALSIEEDLLENIDSAAQTVTAAAVCFAAYCGCDPIILTGVDLAYREGARYADSSVKSAQHGPMGEPLARVAGHQTSTVWQLEGEALAAFAAQHPGTIYNLSQGLPIAGVPTIEQMPPFPQRDLYGAVHAAIQKTFSIDPEPAIQALIQSALRTKKLLEKEEHAEIEQESAYDCFVKPLALFCQGEKLRQAAIKQLELLLRDAVFLGYGRK